MRRSRPTILLLAALLLSGCRVELHRGLGEREANEIVAVLMRQGITAERLADPKDRTITVRVEEGRFADAVEVLRTHGLPRQQFRSMGDVFRGEGLVASPTEERARLIWAMGQELSRTVAEIDGVLSARVHLVLPENDPLRRGATPSSAAVFIRHAQEAPVAQLVPQIKLLVANGVAGLSYDRVAVTLVPAAAALAPATAPPAMEPVLGLWVHADSAPRLRAALMAGAAALAVLLGALGFALWRLRAARPGASVPAKVTLR